MKNSLLIAAFKYYFQMKNLSISDIQQHFSVNFNLAKELLAELNHLINSGRKYRYTGELVEKNGHTLGQIQSLKDFGDVKAGDLGGFIECDQNLRHENNCWVADQAMVLAGAMIWDDAIIKDDAVVEGDVWVYDNAQIYGQAELKAYSYGEIWVSGQTEIVHSTRINVYGSDFGDKRNLCVLNEMTIFSNIAISSYFWDDLNWVTKELIDYSDLEKNLERRRNIKPIWN